MSVFQQSQVSHCDHSSTISWHVVLKWRAQLPAIVEIIGIALIKNVNLLIYALQVVGESLVSEKNNGQND